MKLQYSDDGSIAGGCQETFLLEKSRLVSQDHREANFHIFYHLLAGATAEEREALHLGGDFECVHRAAGALCPRVAASCAWATPCCRGPSSGLT